MTIWHNSTELPEINRQVLAIRNGKNACVELRVYNPDVSGCVVFNYDEWCYIDDLRTGYERRGEMLDGIKSIIAKLEPAKKDGGYADGFKYLLTRAAALDEIENLLNGEENA